MRIQSPSLVELHAFLAVVRAGSFRKAADELCVTQAAVSRAVLRLEQELGQDVLHRTATGIALTPLGKKLLKLTQEPVAALEAAALQLREKPQRLRLRLSVVTSLGTLWLMPRLEDFRVRHPEVDIEFRQYHHNQDFIRDDVDLWIENRPTAGFQWPRQIKAQYLTGKEIVAVCAPKLARDIRTVRQMLAQPLLYHTIHPDNWEVWAKAVGAQMPQKGRAAGFDLVLNLIEAARAGMGVAVVPQCVAEADLQAGRLAMPVAGVASTGRGYYLCRRRSQDAHPAADLFARWVAAKAAGTAGLAAPSRI